MVNQNSQNRARYPERAHKTLLNLTGDLRLAPPKARSRLGSEMTPQQRRAQMKADQWASSIRQKQIAVELERILSKAPDESQLGLPAGVLGPVSVKALRILGDEHLEEVSRKQIPQNARINSKVILLLGDKSLLPAKARWMLGEEDLVFLRPNSKSGRGAFEGRTASEPSCFGMSSHGGNNYNGGGISHSMLPWSASA